VNILCAVRLPRLLNGIAAQWQRNDFRKSAHRHSWSLAVARQAGCGPCSCF